LSKTGHDDVRHDRALATWKRCAAGAPDLFEHPLAQIVLLQQVSKPAYGRSFWHRLHAQVNAANWRIDTES